ncbi:unnamed protein product [Boreogadus saida]
MPVAMRKRSWEEHVTHRSGLPYSFDDLDLVCCRSGGPGPGDNSKHGRQVRCASMPECHHHRPAPDGIPRGIDATASVVGDARLLRETREYAVGKVDTGCSGDGPEESGVLESPGSRCLLGSPREGASSPDSKDRLSSLTVINGTVDSGCEISRFGGSTEHGGGSGGSDDDVVTGAHMVSEEPQQQPCISISLDIGSPLSALAVNQTYDYYETMESQTDGRGEPSEPPGATLTYSAEPESDAVPPNTERQEEIFPASHAGMNYNLSSGEACRLSDPAEDSDGWLRANRVTEQTVTDAAEEECSTAGTERRNVDAVDKVKGLDLPATLVGELLAELSPPEASEGPVVEEMDHSCDSQAFHHSVLALHDVGIAEMDQNREEDRAEVNGQAEVNQSSSTAGGMHVKVQCCTEGINGHVLSEQQLDSGLVTNTIQCEEENMENKSSVNLDGSPVSHDLTFSESQTKSQPGPLENSVSKLDTILEFNSSESDDNPTPQTPTNKASSLADAPLDQQPINMDLKQNTTTLQRPQTEASAEVVEDDLTPHGLPGNRASGCYLGEPPARDGPDGQSKHRGSDTTCSTFEEMEETEAAQAAAAHCGPQGPTPGPHEMSDSEDLKDDSAVKMRVKKRDSSRLDSMVLLLMKLDQLDKEIDNALSATSSMDSTPTPRRRHLDMDPRSQTGNPSQETLVSAAPSKPHLGAKPKTSLCSGAPGAVIHS